ncbi:MAG: hypothetical protein LBL31_01760, partial [Spirochaetaceae bacterium]|nr:hypothetical protein [Spirochaetaceae bacterium]
MRCRRAFASSVTSAIKTVKNLTIKLNIIDLLKKDWAGNPPVCMLNAAAWGPMRRNRWEPMAFRTEQGRYFD